MCWEEQTERSSDTQSLNGGHRQGGYKKGPSLLQASMLPSDIVTCWPLGWWNIAGLCVHYRKLTYLIVTGHVLGLVQR